MGERAACLHSEGVSGRDVPIASMGVLLRVARSHPMAKKQQFNLAIGAELVRSIEDLSDVVLAFQRRQQFHAQAAACAAAAVVLRQVANELESRPAQRALERHARAFERRATEHWRAFNRPAKSSGRRVKGGGG